MTMNHHAAENTGSIRKNGHACYYDPHLQCIMYEPTLLKGDGGGNGVTLSGVVVDMPSPSDDIPFIKPGKLMTGEIIQIFDPTNEEKEDEPSSLSMDCDYENGRPAEGSAGGLLTRSFLETVIQPSDSPSWPTKKERLLQKHRQLRTLHAQQNRKLLHKHQRDRRWFHSNDLNESRLVELETLHQKELLELQSRQQRDQSEMIKLIFSCFSVHLEQSQKQLQEIELQNDQQLAFTAAEMHQPIEKEKQPTKVDATSTIQSVRVKESAAVSKTATLPTNKDASNAVSRPETPTQESITTAPALVPVTKQAAPATSSALSEKAREVKAVMRNRTLTRKERQQKLAEIKERYATTTTTPTGNAASAGVLLGSVDQDRDKQPATTTNKKSIAEQRRVALQSIMKDRSISREEKQKRMAECRAKYAVMSEQHLNRPAALNKIDKTKTQVAVSKKQSEVTTSDQNVKLEMVRQEFAPPSSITAASSNHANDQSSFRSSESNNQSSHVSSRLSPSTYKSDSEGENAAAVDHPSENVTDRWNRAVVKTAISNIVSASMAAGDSMEPTSEDDRDSNPPGLVRSANTQKESSSSRKERALRRRNRTAARTLKSKNDAWATDESTCSDASSYDMAFDIPDRSSGTVPSSAPNRQRPEPPLQISTTETDSNDSNQIATPEAEDPLNSDASSYDMAFDIPDHSSGTVPSSAPNQQRPEPPLQISTTGTDSNDSNQIASIEAEDPLKGIPTDRTPVKKLIRRLGSDDVSLTVLKLDGRKKIKSDDWESLFESLEENSTLRHLSVSRCEISDEVAMSLVLALVENTTLVELQLNGNRGLTEDIAKGFIKVLLKSNKTLKKLELGRTKVSKKSMQKLNEILEERDDRKRVADMQVERQKKIKTLLSFSARDEVAKDTDGEGNSQNNGSLNKRNHLSNSMTSKQSETSKMSARSGNSSKIATSSDAPYQRRKPKRASNASAPSTSSRMSRAGRGGTTASRRGRGGGKNGVRQSTSRVGVRAAGDNRQSIMRASVTAQQMVQLGGDIANVGADAVKLKQQRKLRGECEVCGQRCFTKTMFKTTPLTIPNAVLEGRCLKCNPL